MSALLVELARMGSARAADLAVATGMPIEAVYERLVHADAAGTARQVVTYVPGGARVVEWELMARWQGEVAWRRAIPAGCPVGARARVRPAVTGGLTVCAPRAR